MKIGWNGESRPDLPLEQELAIVAEAGYDGIELFVPKLTPYLASHSAQELHQSMQQLGLDALSLNGIENITFRSPQEFAQIEQECHRLAQLGEAVGCPLIVVVPSPKPAGMSWPDIKAETVGVLKRLADQAAPFGVKLGFEFLAPVTCSVRTLAQAVEIVRATEREDVGVVFDTYHFYVGGSTWESLDTLDLEQLLIVHINDVENLPLDQLTDAHRLLPGEGILPLPNMLQRLHERGYRGAYALEVMRPAYWAREPLEYARAGREAINKIMQGLS